MDILITIREMQTDEDERAGDYVLSDAQVIRDTIGILVKAGELKSFGPDGVIFSERRGMAIETDLTWRAAMIGDGDVISLIHLRCEHENS